MRARPWASLVICSALACALLAGRVLISGRETFLFLVWNLTLAWIPALLSSGISSRRPRLSWVLCGVWLPFFPNAPYLVTDFVHLRARAPIPVWLDIDLLASFGIAGMVLAVASMLRVHRFIADRHGPVAGWLAVTVSCGLAGLGIYVGRVMRWNTWDLLLEPREVVSQVALRLASPERHPGAWGLPLAFGALLLAVYLAASGLGGRASPPDTAPPG